MITDYPTITATDEFLNDQELLEMILARSYGQDLWIDQDTAFVQLIAFLMALARYYIRHQPEGQDIDLTAFLDRISAEVGADLPYTPNSLSILELLRENKVWYSNKGNEQLFTFIGDVIGSALQILYPSDLIFRLDSTRSYLDGAPSTSGELAWNQSKLARIEDGFYWAEYTYIVRVLDAQNVKSFADMITLLNAVHPAGIRRLLQLIYNYEALGTEVTTIIGVDEQITDCFTVEHDWSTLDNGWLLDSPGSKLDMFNGNLWSMAFDVHVT